MRIRFTKAYHVLDGTGTRYDEGAMLTCTEASAAHFIKRGVAVEVKHKPSKKATAKPENPLKPQQVDIDG